jgi:hypothetical protein
MQHAQLQGTVWLMHLLAPYYTFLFRLHDYLVDFQSRVLEERNMVNVLREDVLEGLFRAIKRKTFKMSAPPSVKFVGEDGIDTGGLTREVFSLALQALTDYKLLAKDVTGLCLRNEQQGELEVFWH